MRLGIGPWIAAGIVALAGAGIVAVAPLTSPPPDVEVPVQLTADADVDVDVEPITAWVGDFEAASTDATPILYEWSTAPGPVLQESIAGQIGYSGELPDFQTIFGEVSDNPQAGEPFAVWAATSSSEPWASS